MKKNKLKFSIGILLSFIIILLPLFGCSIKDTGSRGGAIEALSLLEETDSEAFQSEEAKEGSKPENFAEGSEEESVGEAAEGFKSESFAMKSAERYSKAAPASITGDLIIHFIDVGQGDSILVQIPDGRVILIDAGDSKKGNDVVNYLSTNGVLTVDYLIATHPHEDHIGGLVKVIDSFEIGQIYMPKVGHITKVFENVLTKIKDKGLKVNTAKAGISILEESDLNVRILAPVSDKYNEINDYSVVIKIGYGQTSFLLTGDASADSEKEMLGKDLKADLLKVGHHGSRTSTSGDFLKKVSPKYAIISCAKGNSYKHPHSETVERLKENNIDIYRTDEDGTIIAVSDGVNITLNKEK